MLSEEQAIEIVSNLKTYYEAYYLLSNEEIEENEEKNEAIKIVLNLITRLKKENEDIQNRKEHQELRFKKYKEDMEKQHEEIYEDLVFEKEEKDKQIDLMAEYIDKCNYVDSEECQFQYDFKIKGCIEKGDCIDCIKQYFENKAKGE